MRRLSTLFLIFTLHLIVYTNGVDAAINQEEVTRYLTDIGLTPSELEDYLSFYEISIDEFESVEELDKFLGTPINTNNLGSLLATHNLTMEELKTLLANFGESIEDYLFIEDLETSVHFYLKHAEVFQEAKHMLADIGLTDEELDRLFKHVLSLNETTLKDQLHEINSKLEPYFLYDTAADFTSEQKTGLLSLYEEMMNALQFSPQYFLIDNNEVKREISFRDLLETDTLGDSILVVELVNSLGNSVLDIELTEGLLQSDVILDRGEQLLNIAGVADELSVGIYGDVLPNTATPYGKNMLISLLIILAGVSLLKLTRLKKSP